MTRPKSETWFAICDRTTGEAVSFGTVIADELPPHLEAIEIPAQPNKGERTRWDAATKSIVAIPPPPPRADKVDTFIADPTVTAILSELSPGERAALVEKLRAQSAWDGSDVAAQMRER